VALVLAVLAAVFGLRLLAVLAFAVTFVTTGLWTTWEAISHSRHGTSFGPGAWRTGYWAVLVALLVLLLAMVLRWRRPHPTTDDTGTSNADGDAEDEDDTRSMPAT
jgi:H+/Cl- antiporter ClcA